MQPMLAEYEGHRVRQEQPLNFAWLPSAFVLGGMSATTGVAAQLIGALDVPGARRRWMYLVLAAGWLVAAAATMAVLVLGITDDGIAAWSASNRIAGVVVGAMLYRPLRTHARVHEYYGGTARWNFLPWGLIVLGSVLFDSMLGSIFAGLA